MTTDDSCILLGGYEGSVAIASVIKRLFAQAAVSNKGSQRRGTMEDDVDVYSSGLGHASVCSALPKEEILILVNEKHPSGTKDGWSFSENKTFKTGQPNPCPCNEIAGRTHYLLVC